MAPDRTATSRDPEGARPGLRRRHRDAAADGSLALLRPEPPAIFALSAMFAARCSTSETWPSSHSAYLSQPELVVALIRDLAGASLRDESRPSTAGATPVQRLRTWAQAPRHPAPARGRYVAFAVFRDVLVQLADSMLRSHPFFQHTFDTDPYLPARILVVQTLHPVTRGSGGTAWRRDALTGQSVADSPVGVAVRMVGELIAFATAVALATFRVIVGRRLSVEETARQTWFIASADHAAGAAHHHPARRRHRHHRRLAGRPARRAELHRRRRRARRDRPVVAADLRAHDLRGRRIGDLRRPRRPHHPRGDRRARGRWACP